MFVQRLISGVVLVALALVLIITGGDVLLVSTAVISMIGVMELLRVLSVHRTVLAALAYIFTGLFYLDLRLRFIPDLWILVIFYLILLLIVYVLCYPKFEAYQIFGTFFAVFYVAVMLSFIYQTRMEEHGKYTVWLIFLSSWGCDTSAYCVGRLFGKHRMTPLLSPKKTVEGAVGGIAGAFLLTVLYAVVFRSRMELDLPGILLLGLIGAAGGLISMFGDLAASAIKRNYGIKDYGKLIPGHGGILDRFDSVIITAPVIYYLSVLLMR